MFEMENAFWLKFFHDKLRQQKIVCNEPFEFQDISEKSNLTYGDRDKISLLTERSLRRFAHIETGNEKTNFRYFLAAKEANFSIFPDKRILDEDKFKKHMDHYEVDLIYVPKSHKERWEEIPRGTKISQEALVRDYEATIIRLLLRRNLFFNPKKEKASYTSITLRFASPLEEISGTINLGQDFVVLDPYGYQFNRVSGTSEEAREMSMKVETTEFARNAPYSDINHMIPAHAANLLFNRFISLYTPCKSLARVA